MEKVTAREQLLAAYRVKILVARIWRIKRFLLKDNRRARRLIRLTTAELVAHWEYARVPMNGDFSAAGKILTDREYSEGVAAFLGYKSC